MNYNKAQQLTMESTFSPNIKTNREVLDFIKENENKSQKGMFDAAIVFGKIFSYLHSPDFKTLYGLGN